MLTRLWPSCLVLLLAACPKPSSGNLERPSSQPVTLDYDVDTPLPRASNHRYDVPFFTGASYDPSITKPEACLGHPIGAIMAMPEVIVGCFRTWANESPRAAIEQYALSFEGRELVRTIITAPENLAKLDTIKKDIARLADPRGLSAADRERIVKNTPAIALFGYSIHGDEVSGADASLAFGYHLIAGTGSETAELLKNVVVIIDPTMNPDGRARIVGQVRQSASKVPSLNFASMHRGRWPWGRGNHYLFDMNRDWIVGSAPETRGRWQGILTYNPQLVIDAHEMGALETYLFYPQAEPINPYVPATLAKWHNAFAADHSAAFNRYGWPYYTREWADGWYPGYSDAWASLGGAIGILYEQATTTGQPLLRPSGELITYRETVHAQAVSSLSNASTLARNREAVLRDFAAFKKEQIRPSQRAFAIVPGQNPDRENQLVTILMRQGIEVYRTTAQVTARNAQSSMGTSERSLSLPKGSFIIPESQPRGALAKALLDLDVRFNKSVLQKEREELERKGRSTLYDVTSWNLGQAFAVDGYWVEQVGASRGQLAQVVDLPRAPVGVIPADAKAAHAWAVDGRSDASVAFAAHAAERGLAVRIAQEPFSAAGRELIPGSVLIRASENKENAGAIIAEVAQKVGVQALALSTGRSATDGPDLGAPNFRLFSRPRIAVLSNAPVAPQHFGHIWYQIDRQLELPMTMLDAQYLGRHDLRRYNVLIIPPAGGALRSILQSQSKRLAKWLEAGGTLIAVGPSAAMIANDKLGLSKVRLRRDVLTQLPVYQADAKRAQASRSVSIDETLIWDGPPAPSADKQSPGQTKNAGGQPKAGSAKPGSKPGGKGRSTPAALEEKERWMRRFSPRGAMLRALLTPHHWLAFGMGTEMPVLMRGDHVLMSRAPVQTPVRLADAQTLRLSGLLWPEARERLAHSAYATVERVGAGQVVLFSGIPSFRTMTRGTARLFANAVVYGPSLGAFQPYKW